MGCIGFKYRCATKKTAEAREFLLSLGYEEYNKQCEGEWYMTSISMDYDTGEYIDAYFVPLTQKNIDEMSKVFANNPEYKISEDLDTIKPYLAEKCTHLSYYEMRQVALADMCTKICKHLGNSNDGSCVDTCTKDCSIFKLYEKHLS